MRLHARSIQLYRDESSGSSPRLTIVNSVLLAVILSMITLIFSSEAAFSLPLALLIIVGVTTILTVTLRKRALNLLISILMMVALAGLSFLYRNEAISLLNGISTNNVNSSPHIILILIALLSIILYELIVVLQLMMIPLILAIAFLVLAPITGMNLSLAIILIMALFSLYILLLRHTGNQVHLLKENVRSLIIPFMVICLLLSPLIYLHDTFFFNISYQLEDMGITSYLRATHDDDSIISGRISRGNNHRTNRARIRVTVDRLPSSTVYLKNFVGSTYTGEKWDSVDDNRVLEEAVENSSLSKVQYLNWIHYSMYYTLNDMTNEGARKIQLGIKNLSSSEGEPYYIPYLSAYVDQSSKNADYTYNLYEDDQMKINWNKQITPDTSQDHYPYYSYSTQDFDRYKSICRQLISLYRKQALKTYTAVDQTKIPRLSDYVKKHKLSSLNDITAFIADSLEENASYTTTPGNTPTNKDVVEYFLFENHQGYCIHFASAATLMYRLYGVPARYVSGYSVSPTEFKRNSDGTYSATVTDQAAHAWTEILLDDYGWTPVEVTPDSSGSINAQYPGFNLSAAENHLANKNWNLSLNNVTKNKLNIALDITPDRDFFITLFKLILILFVIILSAIKIIRRILKERMNVRRIYTLIQKLYQRRLPGLSGNESDFCDRFKAAYPELDQSDIRRMIDLVNKVNFSPYTESEEDRQAMWQFYEKLYQVTMHQTKIPSKLILIYKHV